jgi:hypothetical protein
MRSKAQNGRYPSIKVFAGIAALAVVVLFLGIAYDDWRTPPRDTWPVTNAWALESRIVADNVVPRKKPIIYWHGQYKVRYNVNGRSIESWVDSGVSSENNEIVRARLHATPFETSIRYNPARAETAEISQP